MNTPEPDTEQIAASTPTRRNGAVFIESESLETLLWHQEKQQEDGEVPIGPTLAVEGALRVFHALEMPALLLPSRDLDNIGTAFGCYEHSTLSTRPIALHGLEIISFCAPDQNHVDLKHVDLKQVDLKQVDLKQVDLKQVDLKRVDDKHVPIKHADNEPRDPADYDLVPDALRELVRHICTGRRIIAADSWFITDRPDYLPCGAISGCATVLLRSQHAGKKRGVRGATLRAPDFVARDLSQAALRIAFERHQTIAPLRTLHAMQASRPPPLPPAVEHNLAA